MQLVISAGPGTGKTTTISNAYYHAMGGFIPDFPTSHEQRRIYDFIRDHLPRNPNKDPSIVYFSHTNAVKDVLTHKLPKKVKVFTFNAAGYSELIKIRGFMEVDKYRMDKFIERLCGQKLDKLSWPQKMEWLWIKKLVTYFKIEYKDPTPANFEYIRNKYSDLSEAKFPHDWHEKVSDLLRMSKHPNKSVDFTDQIWLALHQIRSPRYDLGFVDESQDLGGASLALVRKMCKSLVFVGDRNQAINAFAGADEEMFDKVIDTSDAALPLLTTFRCPINIVERANKLKPDSVLPGPNKVRGEDRTIQFDRFIKILTDLPPQETLVVSRTNAPLLPTALSIFKAGKHAAIADKDIGPRLTNYLKQLKPTSISHLFTKLDGELDKAKGKRHPMVRLMMEELIASIQYLGKDCKTLDDLYHNIKITTNTDTWNAYPLCTIHKAKGLESPNVFILFPPIEHPLAMNHHIAKQQELNLHFVALTRTKKNLYWVVP